MTVDNDLLEVITAFCEKDVAPQVRKIEEEDAAYTTGLLRLAAGIGLQGLICDEQGNLEPEGFVLAHETTEIIASYSGSLALSLGAARLHAYMLCQYARPEVRDRWLPGLLSAEHFGCFAISEPHAGTDVRAITTLATRTPEGDYILNGEKAWITQAPHAAFAIVLAKLDSRDRDAETAAFVVDMTSPGVSVGQPESLIGFRGCPPAGLSFQDVHVPAVARMTVDGFNGMLEGVNLARLDCASYALGFIRGSLRECTRYLSERVAFGAPLSQTQLVRADLGDMHADYLSARHLTMAALDSFAAGGGGDLALVSAAKLSATTAAMRQTTSAVQLLGGAGLHHDHLVQSFFRDAKTIEIIDGTSQIHRLMLGKIALRASW